MTLKVVSDQTGLLVEDSDGDGIPDTRSQMVSIFEFALSYGVLSDNGDVVLRPDQVAGAIYYPEDSNNPMEYLTTVSFQIPGTRNQSVVTLAGDSIKPLLLDLESQPSIQKTGLTGSPFTRVEQLTASTRTLYTSLPIAFVAASLLLMFSMRSIRFAVVTVIPILIVVAWLYGIMFLAGFALNFVTAMIGAISIGVGIDYSIHMTQRFREELRKNTTRLSAMRSAARGTGVALVASATSSVVGFTIMGFAPMPMFASYGRLTALMIFFALMVSLLVLPCLLMLVTKESDAGEINTASSKSS
jgi:predicted RND superfamily exporter protein